MMANVLKKDKCVKCGDKTRIVSANGMCKGCYFEYFANYRQEIRSIIENWQKENPMELIYCAGCGKGMDIPITQGLHPREVGRKLCEDCNKARREKIAIAVEKRKARRSNKIKTAYIYIATNGARTKIGCAKVVPYRMEVLGLEVLHSFELLGALQFEKFLHKKLKDCRKIGEWFDLSETDIQWLLGLHTDGITVMDRDGAHVWDSTMAMENQTESDL